MFYETRTQKDISKLFKYFFFIFVNAIILPIARISQILDAVNLLYKNKRFIDFREQFSLNMIDKSQLFMKYLLTCSLMSQAVALVDLPHAISSCLTRKCSKKKTKEMINL